MSLSLPINGSKKRPTCTVPAEHSQARQAADESYEFKRILFSIFHQMFREKLTTKRILTIPVGVFKCVESQCRATPHGNGVRSGLCL